MLKRPSDKSFAQDQEPSAHATLSETLLSEAELNFSRISLHHKRIKAALSDEVKTTIPIVGACTTNNGGIVSWKALVRFVTAGISPQSRRFYGSAFKFWRDHHVVSCIPAAGAASRFFSGVQKFVLEVERLAPQLKELTDIFFEKKIRTALPSQERRQIQMALLNIKLEADFADLYEKIEAHRFHKIRKATKDLHLSLKNMISKTDVSASTVPGLTLEPQEEPPYEFPPSVARFPWLYTEQEVSTAETEIPKNLNIQPQHFSIRQADTRGTGFDWLSRLESESSSAKPTELSDVFLTSHEDNVLASYSAAKILLLNFATLPKALVPTTNEGDSFLNLKLTEQLRLFPCSANILVSPAGQRSKFEAELNVLGKRLPSAFLNVFDLEGSSFAPSWLNQEKIPKGGWAVIEQGKDLSTIRFQMDGSPFIDEKGCYSPVAAGHGELVHILGSIATQFPEAECMHLRNIDNIIGTSTTRSSELAVPAQAFRIVRDSLEILRAAVEDIILAHDAHEKRTLILRNMDAFKALQFVGNLVDPTLQSEALGKCLSPQGKFNAVAREAIHLLLGNLFHWEPDTQTTSTLADWQRTHELLTRPLSVFGVVRKEVGDMGGGPVFSKLPDGQVIKLCMEMPHASPEDSREYFGPKGRATHFNPVLVFFELKTHCRSFTSAPQPGKAVNFSHLFDDRFWLLTKREYQGKPVCYHETVLYELIGNSATTNLIFVEVPRALFNPHKTIFDSLGQDRRSYGFDETLKSPDSP
jgi:hypothetical protein